MNDWSRFNRSDTHPILPNCRSESSTASLFLPLDQHHQIDIEFASLSQRFGSTCHGKYWTFIVGYTPAVEIASQTSSGSATLRFETSENPQLTHYDLIVPKDWSPIQLQLRVGRRNGLQRGSDRIGYGRIVFPHHTYHRTGLVSEFSPHSHWCRKKWQEQAGYDPQHRTAVHFIEVSVALRSDKHYGNPTTHDFCLSA